MPVFAGAKKYRHIPHPRDATNRLRRRRRAGPQRTRAGPRLPDHRRIQPGRARGRGRRSGCGGRPSRWWAGPSEPVAWWPGSSAGAGSGGLYSNIPSAGRLLCCKGATNWAAVAPNERIQQGR